MPAKPHNAKTFRARLEPDGTRLRWVIARVPFDIGEVWPVRRGRRVRGEINGVPFRTSLFPDPAGKGQVLLVNRVMQKAAGASVGAEVAVRLEPDLEVRTVSIPPELTSALKGDRKLKRFFEGLSDSQRSEAGKWISEPKGAESRVLRAERMAERLMQAMEGEEEPPPILRAAFLRDPRVRDGWNALTQTQRRNHLLGIFYYQTLEARERRAAKAVEDALLAFRKKNAENDLP
jgi:uncharacterized protein YdeI (YjbR/CyaY-like superfamily)